MTIHSLLMRTILLSSVFLSLFLTGCMGLGSKAVSMQAELAAGRVSNALAIAENENSSEDEVLASLNKGMLRRMKRDYQGSNQIFEVAKKNIEELYGVSVTEQAGALIVNDTLRSFSGDRYEQVLLHAYMAMNYIQLDDFDSARIEMKQAEVKMMEWGDDPEDDPFVRYLSGMIYEELGEKDQAVISYRQAKDVYKSTSQKQTFGVPTVLKMDLLRSLANEGFDDEFRALKKELKMKKFKPEVLTKGFGELIVILNSGLAPVRKEVSISAVTNEVTDTVKIAIPSYPDPQQRFSARLSTNHKLVANLELVENIDGLARAALNNDLPIITTRAIARAVVKHKTQSTVEEKGGALAGFLATAFNVVSEQADTRSWITLPQTIQMARVKLPVGMNKVNIDIYNASGRLVDRIEKEILIKSGKSSFITEHWVAPNMSLVVMADKNRKL
ncbi:MAG: hypothetical protein OEY06_05920 [Gammaproteobacteria bacterium]|nr:hypothetical protein [Gammaproteobacteria bacterium]